MSDPNQIPIEKIKLFKEKFIQMVYADERFFNEPDVDISTYASWMYSQYAVRIKDYVWAERLETQEIRCPIDWKEAFKERWFPKWWLNKWPVKYVKKVIEAKALYPTLKMASHKPVIQITQTENPEWWKYKEEDNV